MREAIKARTAPRTDTDLPMTDHGTADGIELLGSLDETPTAAQLAYESCYSPAQFYRVAKKRLGERPMTLRRRLLLERAAYVLLQQELCVSEIAFDARYSSVEAFCRAFARAYGISPARYRRLAPTDYWLDRTARLHFAPSPAGGQRKGERPMNVVERMVEHHCQTLDSFLSKCEVLADDQLDIQLQHRDPFPWSTEPVTVRSLLAACCSFAGPWMETINGVKVDSPLTLPEMRRTLQTCRAGFYDLYHSIESDGSWDLTFVDSLCEPPEVFSYGGVIGHMLTFNAYRRVLLIMELKALGIEGLGFGDPLELQDVGPLP